MAQKKKIKKTIIRLELGLGGIFGLTIICFCIFLWMFLFGIWTGQTILENSSGSDSAKELVNMASKMLQDEEQIEAPSVPENKIIKENEKSSANAVKDDQESEPSFFSIQVSAFKEKDRASRSVVQWRARDYESFYLIPDLSKSKFYRVFVGRFESLAEANAMALKFEEFENDKVFITLVSSKEKLYP